MESDNMDISSAMGNQIASVRNAINMSAMEKSLSQDGATVSKLIEGMEETSEAVQNAAGPNRGNNIDIRV